MIDQGTLLDRVDYNVEQMSVDVKGAVEELKAATSCVSRYARLRLIHAGINDGRANARSSFSCCCSSRVHSSS